MSKRFAIIFGLNYPGTNNALSGCINDSKYWESLATQKNFDHIEVLTNAQCSKGAMVDALNRVCSMASPGDLVIDAYSGHGTILPPSSQSLVPDNFDWDKPDTWLCYDELDRIFLPHELRGVNIVAIHDSCHSQANKRFKDMFLNPHPTKNRFIDPPQFIKDRIVSSPYDKNVLDSDRGVLLLSGCQKKQTSADFYCDADGTYHGAFTYYTSVALTQNPKLNYLDAVLKARSLLAGNGFDQVPGADGDDAFRQKEFFE